jgi:hypothetical protein
MTERQAVGDRPAWPAEYERNRASVQTSTDLTYPCADCVAGLQGLRYNKRSNSWRCLAELSCDS